ncbi:sensor domain-containing protein [Halosimplex salinum]|uniref:sensor domain-containing protein n=1 Tax=Halosimplex salinum TaxID=1710538 RepID=UPI0013DD9C86|nr:sensor domain-containing protein [Halosimplex salinum]
MTTSISSALGRFFGVAVDPQTYRNLTYLLLTFPLGVLYFTMLWGGGSAGIAMIPILVGIPLLVAVLAVAVNLAELETRLARGLLDSDVTYETPNPTDETLVEYATRLATDPRSYLAVGYLLSKFVVGLAAFVGLTVLGTLSASFALAPLLYSHPEIAYQLGPTTVDTLPVALALSAGGVLLAVVSLHVCNFAARALGEYTEVLLGTGAEN